MNAVWAVVTLGVIVMSLFAFFKSLWNHRGKGISILVPFRCNDLYSPRLRNWEWLKRYWEAQLPGAEVIMGEDPATDKPFSKSVAVNNAARKARGDIFVIVDADGYMDIKAVLHCADEIRRAEKRGKKLWFVPYRQFYRLTEAASKKLISTNPAKPFKFGEPLEPEHILGDTDPKVGHWYGAMIQIMSRNAFELVGGWDERFRGWGGEDGAAMRAMDTLYGLHKTLPGQVLHVWHPQIGPKGSAEVVSWKERMWEGQAEPNTNDTLIGQYWGADRRPERMRKLVDEGHSHSPIGEGVAWKRQTSA